MIKFGVIGYGYWGPNVVRNLHTLEGGEVGGVCDKSQAARRRVQKTYPGLRVTADPSELFTSTEIDALAVVAPVLTQYKLTKAALEECKPVATAKPVTIRVLQPVAL